MPKDTEFDATFVALKEIFEPYKSKLIVAADTANNYALETHHVLKNKRRLYFGGVRKGKAYVSFHLMPVYTSPDIAQKISPELKNEKLFNELRRLTKSGFTRFTSKKFDSPF